MDECTNSSRFPVTGNDDRPPVNLVTDKFDTSNSGDFNEHAGPYYRMRFTYADCTKYHPRKCCRLEKTADQVSEILAIANITGVPSLFFIQEKR